MRYIALHRAINVGGHRIIKMVELKAAFESLGFENVKTYIQSGNVAFDAPEQDEQALKQQIEQHLQTTFGFEVATFIRTVSEMEAVTKINPFLDRLSDEVKMYVTFLDENPPADRATAVEEASNHFEQFRVIGREVYILLRNDAPKPIFNNNWLESKLKMRGTARNWNTVNRMVSL